MVYLRGWEASKWEWLTKFVEPPAPPQKYWNLTEINFVSKHFLYHCPELFLSMNQSIHARRWQPKMHEQKNYQGRNLACCTFVVVSSTAVMTGSFSRIVSLTHRWSSTFPDTFSYHRVWEADTATEAGRRPLAAHRTLRATFIMYLYGEKYNKSNCQYQRQQYDYTGNDLL